MKLAKAIRDALDKTTRNGEGAWPISGGDLAGHVIIEAITELEREEAKPATRAYADVDKAARKGAQ